MTTTSDLKTLFEERYDEIDAYVNLLEDIERAAMSGAPKIEGTNSRITASQQKILYSSLYLQLYNLVESTVSQCLDAVAEATVDNARWRPIDLNEKLRGEWVRSIARTHVDLNADNRLKSAMEMCDHLIRQLPMQELRIEKGGGGNWDDEAIEKITMRIGCTLAISKGTRSAIKRAVRDDLGPMKLVKNRRNSLAHGSISFTDCADGVAVSELRSMTDAVSQYLREAIECFISYIDLFEFLHPSSKPTRTA